MPTFQCRPWVWFVHVPRTGGTSLSRWLGSPDPPGGHVSAQRIRDSGALGSGWCFGTVRNPWDRAVSWFTFEVPSVAERPLDEHPEAFARWLAERGARMLDHPQWSPRQMLCDRTTGETIARHVLRFERLEIEARGLFPEIAAPFPAENASPRSRLPLSAFYGPEQSAVIERVCAWEIERFGYRLEDS